MLNPFSNIAARNWLAESLWKNNPPGFRRPVMLFGDGPFEPREFARFLNQYGIHVRNGFSLFDPAEAQPNANDEDYLFGSFSPPLIVLGTQNVDGSEFRSLLMDKLCNEKPATVLPAFCLDKWPYWISRYSLRLPSGDFSILQRSPSLKDIEFSSQEALLACLFASCASPSKLPSPWPEQLAAHPWMNQLPALRQHSNQGGFKWPSTQVTEASGAKSVGNNDWPQIGLLSYSGYGVGHKGNSEQARKETLSRVFEMTHIPRLESEEYVRSWGTAKSATRLKKMADTIAALCRNAKRKDTPDMTFAIEGWEADLAWLKRTYYDGVYDHNFTWPTTQL